jgi:hypothetical protein
MSHEGKHILGWLAAAFRDRGAKVFSQCEEG